LISTKQCPWLLNKKYLIKARLKSVVLLAEGEDRASKKKSKRVRQTRCATSLRGLLR
jgi:hypothetical protein